MLRNHGRIKASVNRLVEASRAYQRKKARTPANRPAITGRLGAAVRTARDVTP